jgi:hypothetical protein
MAASEKHRSFSTLGKWATGATLFVLVCWGAIVVLAIKHWDNESLQKWGTFGDSFGTITALFTGATLIGAAIAVYIQHKQLVEQRETNRAGEVENRFFRLLESFQTAINETVVDKHHGREAIRFLANTLVVDLLRFRENHHVGPQQPLDERQKVIDKWYTLFYEGGRRPLDVGDYKVQDYGSIVGYLFRLTYQIVRYVDESAYVDDVTKHFYIRILRAHFSNPELLLLFYNALSHYGYEKFFPLIEKYNLLKNINRNSLPDAHDSLLFKSLREPVDAD